MFGFMLFLHLTGLAIWIGSMLAIVVTLSLLKKQLGSKEPNELAGRVIRAFSLFAHPSAVVVLGSGVYMIVKAWGGGSDRPLWLDVMEKGGGMVLLLALILTGILGGKVRKRLKDVQGQGSKVKLGFYLSSIAAFVTLAIAVVLVVSIRI
ncbi:hypothetical protein ACFPVX_04930 [Cohnella faecalis]|uniref:DUF2269 family protein n=1 Tax=Cohnella faecalis TaxID=2315694 RepID=A0A398CXL9_9BACL|nr:hypothetical protein [Cohnella faecalis]RIE03971.1 hypothetical protein D3H35_08405 [Cohnella faecalis]